MSKFFTIELWKDGQHGNSGVDKRLRTWNEVMVFLKDMYQDCDSIMIRYVGDR